LELFEELLTALKAAEMLHDIRCLSRQLTFNTDIDSDVVFYFAVAARREMAV